VACQEFFLKKFSAHFPPIFRPFASFKKLILRGFPQVEISCANCRKSAPGTAHDEAKKFFVRRMPLAHGGAARGPVCGATVEDDWV
jgi:hypothetical protein